MDDPAKRRRVPKVRETRMINALVSGQAKTLSAAMIQAGFNPASRSVRDSFNPGGDLRLQLDEALESAGLTMPIVLNKLFSKMEAKKHLTIAGQAIETEDHDAQLRATEQVIKLHDRTGRLPASQDNGVSGGSTITVNILVMDDPTKQSA